MSLDTFIQVVGLVINTCDRCPTGEVFIATYMESIIIQDCDFSNMDSWTVYAMSSRRSDTHIAGDMFVFTKDNKLLITASVVQFTLCGITKLKKVLQGSKIDKSRPAEPLSLTPKVTRGEVGGSGAKVKIYDHDHNYEDETMVATEAVSIEPTKNCKTIPSGDLAGYVHCCWFGEPSSLATGGKRSAGKRPGTQRLG